MRHYPTTTSDCDIEEYISNNSDNISTQLSDAIHRHTAIKFYTTMDIKFYRSTADGQLQETTARFRTSPDILSDIAMFDPIAIAREFTSSVENFNRRGSGWTVDLVVDFYITLAPHRPTQCSSYVPTPQKFEKKQQS